MSDHGKRYLKALNTHGAGKHNFKLELMAFLYLVPLGVQITQSGDKPVIFAVSITVLFIAFISYLRGSKMHRSTFIYCSSLAVFAFIGVLGTILGGGSIGPLLSVASFSIPLLHVFVGPLVARYDLDIVLRSFALPYALVILMIFGSDVINANFPRGCGLQGRWGGCFGPFEVFGFVNASANFLAILSPLLYLLIFDPDKRYDRLLGIVSLFALFIISFLSLSRSASLLLALSMLLMSLKVFRVYMVFFFAAVLGVLFYFWEKILSSFVVQGIALRFSTAIENGDVTTGRVEIWTDAFRVAVEHPFLGGAFGFFSDYSDFGTAHQQFAEVAFKAGILGFVAYFGFLLFAYTSARKVIKKDSEKKKSLYLYWINILLLLIIISCVFQSIISYHIFGSIVFFFSGYFIEREARNETTPPKSL